MSHWNLKRATRLGHLAGRGLSVELIMADDVVAEAGTLGELGPGPHADADDHQVRRQCGPACWLNLLPSERRPALVPGRNF